MRIILLSDIHFKEERRLLVESLVQQIGSADLVLIAGDLVHFKGVDELKEVLEIIRPLSSQVYAVAGNCDTKATADYLRETGMNIAGRAVECGRCIVQGMEGAPLWRKVDYGFTEDQLGEQLQRSEDQAVELLQRYDSSQGAPIRIVLTHVPPYNSGADKAMFLLSVGSHALRDYLEARPANPVLPPVRYNFCGHIHEGRGDYQLGKTTILNIGALKNSFYAEMFVPDGDEPPTWEFHRGTK